MRDRFKQGGEFHEVTRGLHGSGHRPMELFKGRRQARSVGHMANPQDPPDLVGQHLNPQTGDEAGQHCPGQKIGEKCQPEDPEYKEQQN